MAIFSHGGCGSGRLLALLLLLLLLPEASRASADKFESGVATRKVVALNKGNLQAAINDPANSFWFLKFFAPWCGHCKKLAPVLDKVAPKTAGQMSIGTIDCTVEKKLCDEYKVRGYPTLKFSLDGEIFPYEGGRTERDLMDFSAKMLRPIVELVESVDAAQTFAAEKAEEGVAFLAYNPALVASSESSTTLDEKLQSTPLTQVFAQVARNQRAAASFMLLDTGATEDDESAAAVAAHLGQEGPFICRLEANVAPRCFDKVHDITTANLLPWVEKQNVATVSHLGAHNFHKIGRSGRPLAIAVVSEQSTEELGTAKRELALYAVSGPAAVRDKYYYGWVDGHAWKKFLEQFEVVPKDMPQVFVLDVPHKTFWQNATYKLNIDDFLQAIEDGTVKAKSAGKKGLEGGLTNFYNLMVAYRPWSAIAAILLLVALALAIVSCITPGDDLRPPYPRKQKSTSAASDASEKKTSKVKFEGDKGAESKSDEPKKDK